MGYLYAFVMEDIDINGILVYVLPLNESATKKLLWAFDEFDGSKHCECVEQITFSLFKVAEHTYCKATIQPMQIWHNGNTLQYLRLLQQLNRTDMIKYNPIMCADYEKPETFEPDNYPNFKWILIDIWILIGILIIMKQTLYPLVILNGLSDDGKLSGIHCNSNDVNDWMQQFDGWEQIQRFLAINVDNGGIVFAYKWGADGWYSSDCLSDCNGFEQKAFREMMAEVGITAEFLNNPNWIRWELVGDSVANIRKFMKF